MGSLLGLAVLAIGLAWVGVVLIFWPDWVRAWREPTLRYPVIIIESDDWSPGPAVDADVLREIVALLKGFHDVVGRSPVMTLGITLSLVDTAQIAEDRESKYERVLLDDPRTDAVLSAMRDGMAYRCFDVQLHGMAHYWPATLLRAAATQQSVAAWLRQEEWPRTETLPSPLQSRWVDSTSLPSRPHDAGEVTAAVMEEVAEFRRIFGMPPHVIVPPTFVWTNIIENAWASQGIEFLVSPGRQFIGRGARGELVDAGRKLFNGERGGSGLSYVVRDVYFEPERGHTAARTVDQIADRFLCGRPALLEMHRSNFIGDPSRQQVALSELGALLTLALHQFPDLRFVSTAELARALRDRDTRWVDVSMLRRLTSTLRRMQRVRRCGRLMQLFGLAWFACFISKLVDTKAVAAL